MNDFVKKAPKVELHAHLNGSLTTATFLELSREMYGESNEHFKKLCESFKKLDNCSFSECFEKFKFAHQLTATRECLKLATICAIRDFAHDNVIYLELRTTPKANASMSKEEYLHTVLEGIEEANREYPDIMVKLLPSIDRSQGAKVAEDTVNIVIGMSKKYPSIIKGVDLSGNPATETFTSYRNILDSARASGLKLALHCGEIDNESEVSEMIDFGMDRCGHGTFITGENLRLLREKGIPIECCLSSNVKCGTVKSYEDHHFNVLFGTGHPVIICTDDFGVFDSDLSNEMLIASRTFSFGKTELHKLSINAVNASFANESEKSAIRSRIDNYFDCNK